MKRMGKIGQRLLALLLCAVLVPALCLRLPAPARADDTLDDLQGRVSDLQRQMEDTKAQIAAAEKAAKNGRAERALYQQQRDELEQQIELIKQQIELMEQRVDELSAQIDQKQADFDARWAGFKERMATMQMMDDGGSIALLSSVTNLYELLTFTQTLEDIATRDQEICQELENERIELENDRLELQNLITQLGEQEKQLDAKCEELAAAIQKLNSKISAAEAEAEAYEAALSEQDKLFKDALAALDAYIASQNKNVEGSVPTLDTPIEWGIPIARYTRVSDRFGNTGTRNHGGVDIAAPLGTPIYASADGVVSVSHTWDGHTKSGTESYGNYVVLLHGTYDGKSYETRYAHMNATPPVRVGANVKKGDIIGYVGSTGNSTGPHLHLELRINGGRVNPLSAIPLP